MAGERPRRHTAPSAAVHRKRAGAHLYRLAGSVARLSEPDLVAHNGPRASGSFICTLVLKDIGTGWTECAPLLVREQK